MEWGGREGLRGGGGGRGREEYVLAAQALSCTRCGAQALYCTRLLWSTQATRCAQALWCTRLLWCAQALWFAAHTAAVVYAGAVAYTGAAQALGAPVQQACLGGWGARRGRRYRYLPPWPSPPQVTCVTPPG